MDQLCRLRFEVKQAITQKGLLSTSIITKFFVGKGRIYKLLENLIQKKILVDKGRIYFEYEKVLELKLPGTVKILKEKNLGKKSYVLAEITYPSS